MLLLLWNVDRYSKWKLIPKVRLGPHSGIKWMFAFAEKVSWSFSALCELTWAWENEEELKKIATTKATATLTISSTSTHYMLKRRLRKGIWKLNHLKYVNAVCLWCYQFFWHPMVVNFMDTCKRWTQNGKCTIKIQFYHNYVLFFYVLCLISVTHTLHTSVVEPKR